MESEIELKNVCKAFMHDHETVSVLKGISAKVTKGTIVTIVGPSGSGKSTILSLCNLLQTPDEGEIHIHGKEVREWNIQELRRLVGIAFQDAPMLKGTSLDNLSLPARLQGKSLENPKKYMKYVGLTEDLLSRQAKELSGGQKQRLAFARTLVNEPSVLLLDEVTSALDSLASHEVEELVLRINREQHTTILWVTHDLSQAERVGDQTWLVMDGSIIEAAPTKQFFTEPKDVRTKQFLDMKRNYK
ncbi:phosphate ABC transporter ATP-binding protein [Peribacillus cavernae]|uniref:Phosphate ABC transporter ATP-binding protein n=1 Tax=Peribacillus cavernae TaxID=1674310 RepID=A0A3S0VIR4_9BACI|nr:phosphate ABC transporter ATP-binding protein [Peribacillus cavernae]MDQ0220195.1 putative ABC transport system ATP-binding protein [Peribacillus cavernae]RUQ28819.1 phosphate ABC transporter ATP-binding protein [Peribacillus cavernae]